MGGKIFKIKCDRILSQASARAIAPSQCSTSASCLEVYQRKVADRRDRKRTRDTKYHHHHHEHHSHHTVAIFREDGFDELLLKRELQLFITVSGAVKVPRAVRIGRNSNRSVRRGFVQGWCDGSTSRVLFVLKLHSMTSKLCCVQLR